MGLASVVTTSIGLGIRTHQVAVEKTMDLRPEMQTVDVTHAGQSASYERACVGLSPSNLSCAEVVVRVHVRQNLLQAAPPAAMVRLGTRIRTCPPPRYVDAKCARRAVTVDPYCDTQTGFPSRRRAGLITERQV